MKNIPKLRFPEFTGEWETKIFSEEYDFIRTNSLSRSQLNNQNGKLRNIHYGDIHTKFNTDFYINNNNLPYINSDVDISKVISDHYCKAGDLVIADASEDYAAVGKTIEIRAIEGVDVVAGLHTYLARNKISNQVIGFMGKMMQTDNVRKQLCRFATGVSVLGITKGNFSKIKYSKPSLAEQQRIADFLSVFDEKILGLSRKKALLEDYKKGVMQKLFSQQIRFTNKNNTPFPNWKEKKLGEVAKIYDGTHQTPKYVKEGIPFYSVEHITRKNFFKTKFISNDVYQQEIKRVKIEKNDILMTRIGDVGSVKYINWAVKASFYVSLALIKQSEKFVSKFLAQYILSDKVQRELYRRTIHVAFPKKINLGEISHCLICLPCEEEQQKIADFLTAIDQKITHATERLEKVKSFKKALLQQMFI